MEECDDVGTDLTVMLFDHVLFRIVTLRHYDDFLPASSECSKNDGELARHDPAHRPKFGVKLVSKVADWAGFAGYAVF
jgi:hypothetical protein